ncbi:MBL fold metallo-hydrolase [Virgibacillus halodenitrificans]|uniref:MBL fold metallo-hydrolase n=1 Tax=Virgibacillus halodenitrificans TaxID=1482 RepID=A0ABR7VN28_VIRHA|nr:MBL fold metallo-hydrolase [Virgibacillus halodenitrificans]MBD1222680.1 MBL fold metallo-hydrolase [Virgibacillus halodenitrificans]
MKVINKDISQITIPTPFAVGDTHVYLLKGDTLSLVDAGVKTKEAWEALTSQLKQLNYSPNDIEQIILTHHHPDHIGLIEEFPRVRSIVGHRYINPFLIRDEGFIDNYIEFFKSCFHVNGVPDSFQSEMEKERIAFEYFGRGELTEYIDEGQNIPGHEDWGVIETKGHAQSHLSFLREQDGMFIGGDHLLQHISPNPLIEPPYEGQNDRSKSLLQFRSNLIKCKEASIRTVLPGHGPVFSNVDEVVEHQLSRQEQRADKVYQYLKKESASPYQICKQLFPKQYEKQIGLTMSETIGQLDYLENEGLIEKDLVNGQYVYETK